MVQVGIPVLGVVENMSGLVIGTHALRFVVTLPDGGQRDVTSAAQAALASIAPPGTTVTAEGSVFAPSRGGAAAMATSMQVPFLGRVPLDPELARASEEGHAAFPRGGPATAALEAVVDRLLDIVEPGGTPGAAAALAAAAEGARSRADAEVEPYLNGSGNLVSV